MLLTRDSAGMALQDGRTLRMRLADSKGTNPVGSHRLLAKTNYLAGPDATKWKRNIANYEGVVYPQVYPGIDMAWHTRGDQLEHDFVVAAHADPRRIRLVFSGVPLRPAPDGRCLRRCRTRRSQSMGLRRRSCTHLRRR